MPAVKTALSGASRLVSELLPKIVQEVPSIINDNLPILAEAAISIIKSLVDGISENQEMLMETAFDTIVFLANSLISMLPQIVALGLDLIVSLANGIAESLPELIPAIAETILMIVDTLTSPDMLSKILDAALVLIVELAYGLMEAIPQLAEAITQIITNLVAFLKDPENITKIWSASWQIIIALATGLLMGTGELGKTAFKLIEQVIEVFKDTDWGEVGKNIVDGLLGGLKKAWTSLKKWFTNAWDNLVGGVKDLLGIHSPSRVFAGIGKNMALGVGEGWDDSFGDVEDGIYDSLDFGDVNYGIATAGSSIGSFGGADAVGGLSIVQNIYSEAKSAADLMREALWQQEKAVYLGV
jgi:phage-related protein